jgi:hypothetical protein
VSYPELELEVISEPAWPITFDLNGAGLMLANYAVVLFGWAVRNVSSGTEAKFDIYDGTDASGVPVFPVNLAGNETNREWFGPNGVRFRNGVYVNVTAQEVKGSVIVRRHRER